MGRTDALGEHFPPSLPGPREPGGFVPRSQRVPGAAGGAVGGHLLPPPVRRAMPSGEGPRASPGAAVRGLGEQMGNHLQPSGTGSPCPGDSGTDAHACKGSQDLSRPGCWLLTCLTAFSPVSTVQCPHSFPQFVLSGYFGLSDPPSQRMTNTNSLEAPGQQQYQEVSWLLPSGRAAVGSRGRSPLPFPPRCSSQQLPAPLAFPVSSGMLGWGLDTRAGCATLLCQGCLLAARLWPGGCPAAGQPAVTR